MGLAAPATCHVRLPSPTNACRARPETTVARVSRTVLPLPPAPSSIIPTVPACRTSWLLPFPAQPCPAHASRFAWAVYLWCTTVYGPSAPRHMQLERCSTTRLALEPFARRPGPEAQDRATRRAAAAAVLHLRHLARCLVTARQKNPKYHAPRRKRPGSGQKRRPLVSIALVDWKLLRPGRDSSPVTVARANPW